MCLLTKFGLCSFKVKQICTCSKIGHLVLNLHFSPTDADRDALVVTDFEEKSNHQHDKNMHDVDSSSESDGLYDTDLEEEFPGELKCFYRISVSNNIHLLILSNTYINRPNVAGTWLSFRYQSIIQSYIYLQ